MSRAKSPATQAREQSKAWSSDVAAIRIQPSVAIFAGGSSISLCRSACTSNSRQEQQQKNAERLVERTRSGAPGRCRYEASSTQTEYSRQNRRGRCRITIESFHPATLTTVHQRDSDICQSHVKERMRLSCNSHWPTRCIGFAAISHSTNHRQPLRGRHHCHHGGRVAPRWQPQFQRRNPRSCQVQRLEIDYWEIFAARATSPHFRSSSARNLPNSLAPRFSIRACAFSIFAVTSGIFQAVANRRGQSFCRRPRGLCRREETDPNFQD